MVTREAVVTNQIVHGVTMLPRCGYALPPKPWYWHHGILFDQVVSLHFQSVFDKGCCTHRSP